MQTRPEVISSSLSKKSSLRPLPRAVKTECKGVDIEQGIMTQSSKSTQGSEPSPLLECEECVDLRRRADTEDAPVFDRSCDSSSVLSCEVSLVTAYEDLADPETGQSWCTVHKGFVFSLLEKEVEYAANPFALQLAQPQITPMMRAVLLDWMMEVCSEFTLKRETYYLSAAYVDRYLSLRPSVPRQTFQLLGLAAMVVAAKVEEVLSPNLSDFAKAADSGFSVEEIKEMEKGMLRTLAWKVVPPTVFTWANLAMTLWDEYLQATACDSSDEPQLILFKQASQTSYRRYRETMQMLDVAYLDVDVLRYSPRNVVAGLLYLMVSKYFYETDYALLPALSAKIPDLDSSLSLYFGDGSSPVLAHSVQVLFSDFILRAMEIRSVADIYPTTAFLNSYLDFDSPLSLPVACTLVPRARLESHYEDFLAFQTHADGNLTFAAERLRNQCSN